MSNLDYKKFYHKNLPHYQPEGNIFAVSFRLAFSLPQDIKEELIQEKKQFEKTVKNLNEKQEQSFTMEFYRRYFDKFDDFIAKYSLSPKWLTNENVGKIVSDSIKFFDGVRYDLFAFCIMPNHVHLLLKPYEKNGSYYSISEILHSIKGYSAKECDKILNQTGTFWKYGHYDHSIRNSDDFAYQLFYLLNNPVKSGLVENWEDWKFTYLKGGLL